MVGKTSAAPVQGGARIACAMASARSTSPSLPAQARLEVPLPLRRAAEELHRRGARPVAELLAVLARLEPEVESELWREFEGINRHPPALIEAAGAARFDPPRLRVVSGGRP